MSVSSFSMWNLLSGLLPKLVVEIPTDAHDDDLSVEMRSLNKSTTRFGGVASRHYLATAQTALQFASAPSPPQSRVWKYGVKSKCQALFSSYLPNVLHFRHYPTQAQNLNDTKERFLVLGRRAIVRT
ncbi:MAG: hypothetical protein JWP08_4289 [Bryobacterales bacterium]|nr:hypothetical protein [Bryobacterales bacterium]